jgi:short-subunit dehydrogenase
MDTTSQRPLAVVTGASTGIGRELAREFEEHDFDVIGAADEDAPGVVRVDLATPEGVEALYRHVQAAGRPVAALALNAGTGKGGAFADTELDDDLRVIDLNVRSTVHLVKRFVPDMVARGEGRILITSSIAAGSPGPFNSIYNASKSFVQSFALALREELEDTGVTVTALMPGPTDTEFFDRADMTDTRLGASEHKDDPVDVARDGFEAMMAGKERAVSASLATKLQARASRFTPDSVKAALHKHATKPGSAE